MIKIKETLFALIVGLSGSCFDPQIKSGFSCYSGECPPQQVCHTDNICYFPEDVPESKGYVDAGVPVDMDLPAKDSVTPDASVPPLDALVKKDEGIQSDILTRDASVYPDTTPDISLELDASLRSDAGVLDATIIPDVEVVDPESLVVARAGRNFNCFLRENGQSWCGVENEAGQSNQPSERLDQICASAFSACGLTPEGRVLCWGAETEGVNYGQANVPESLREEIFGKLSCGDYHVCLLKEDGSGNCFGRNDQGQAPRVLPGTYQDLSLGGLFTVLVDESSQIVVLGDDTYNQRTDAPEGVFDEVSSGYAHACARREDGTITCWGRNDNNQAPLNPEGNFDGVSAGGYHTYAWNELTITSWGRFEERQREHPEGYIWDNVSAGARHTCGISDGEAYCWGDDSYGQTTTPED